MHDISVWGIRGEPFASQLLYDPATLTAMATVAQVAGTVVTAAGTIAAGKAAERQGRAAQQAADFEAEQMEMAGKEEFAQKQREAFVHRRNKKLALSKLQSVGAASGFSADDTSTMAIADEIEKYGTLQEQTALYGGEVRKRDMNLAASGRRFEGDMAFARGKDAKTASYFNAGSTILGGVSTMADRYAPRRRTASVGRYG